MLTKEQYESILPHKEVLMLFKKSGQWIGGEAIYSIHKSIFNQYINMSCNNCKAKAVTEILIALELYEKGNL